MILKEELSRYYHARGLPKTFLGSIGKVVVEGGFWLAATVVAVTAAVIAPWPILGGIELLSREYLQLSFASATAFTATDWCLSTLPPDEI